MDRHKRKTKKTSDSPKKKKTRKLPTNIEFEEVEIPASEKIEGNKLTKKHLKIPIEFEIMESSSLKQQEQKEKEQVHRWNEEFIDILEQLANIMTKHGEPFRSRAYQKALETIMAYPNDILVPSQLKGLPGIGETIMEKLNEYVQTGTLRILEREKTNPINILGEVYGIGPKKAEELVKAGVRTIDELRARQGELLNDIQKVGLRYHDDIIQRIPRQEIQQYDQLFHSAFAKVAKTPEDKFEIVGSYRRGAQTSGDIDVIITGNTGQTYKAFVDELLRAGVILEVLSRGTSKTLVIARLPGQDRVARRVDFLYAPPNEYAFAILYFTGSKIFNTVMRQYALKMDYTFNEHGIYIMKDKKKGEIVLRQFRTEKDIFDFLGLEYKAPTERKDGRAVIVKAKKQPALIEFEEVAEEPAQVVEVVEDFVPATKEKAKKTKQQTQQTQQTKAKTTTKTLKKSEVVFDEVSIDETELMPVIQQFIHNGINVLDALSEKQLEDILKIANQKYYNQQPIMTDNQYDIIKEYVESKYPSNAVIAEIGAEVERNKVTLPYPMPSMDKIKPDTGSLASWTIKYRGPYVLSCKVDGVSGLYTTEGDVPKLYTRGNGTVGQDVSHLIPYLRLPKTKGIAIRGEFIMPKAVFEQKYKQDFANPRNMVAGLINHKTINQAIQDVNFVAYEVIKPVMKPSEQMDLLGTLGVERVLYQIRDTLSNESLSTLLVEWRQNYKYEIDGVIVANDSVYPRRNANPEHAFAFKMVLSDQVAEAKVVDVLWTPSKDGYLKPRVRIEPLQLGGVTIEYATGFNAAFINDNKIGIGATIQLIRSGDVIPYIKSVVVPAPEPKMPSVPFKWNDTHVDIMLINAQEDPTVKEKNITGFFRGLGVEGLSSGNIMRLIGAGYDTVPEIIGMSKDDFLSVEGFKEKMAEKLYSGIREKLEQASIITLMAASNIFGRGFSEKRLELILGEVPDILVSDDTDDKKISEVAEIKGMGTKSAEAFVEKIDDFKDFLEECGLEDKLYEEAKQPTAQLTQHPLNGKTVVLTGTRDKAIIDFLKSVGAVQGASVSKNTSLVVAKDPEDDTGKAAQARKLGIPIMSVDQFQERFM